MISTLERKDICKTCGYKMLCYEVNMFGAKYKCLSSTCK